jgi:antitoxin CptB
MIDPSRKAKITWQCRRGMLELDLILHRFINHFLPTMSEDQVAAFEKLLTSPDPLLYSWLMGTTDPEDQELFTIVDFIRRHADS